MLLFLYDFIMNMFVLWIYFLYISRHSLTSFVHCAKNSKKKNPTDSIRRLFTLWYDWNNFYVYVFFTPILVLNVVFWICMKCLVLEMNQWFEFIILRSPEKEVPWKFWLDPRFSRNPKLKWILKWLPFDRVTLNFTFCKRRKFANNPVPYISQLVILSFCFKSCLHCHAFCFCLNCPVVRYY